MKYQIVQLKVGWAVQNTETMSIVCTYKSKYNAETKADEMNSWRAINSAPVYTLRVRSGK